MHNLAQGLRAFACLAESSKVLSFQLVNRIVLFATAHGWLRSLNNLNSMSIALVSVRLDPASAVTGTLRDLMETVRPDSKGGVRKSTRVNVA
jgi:hypothetical protein